MVGIWAFFGILGANIAKAEEGDIVIKFIPIMTKETLQQNLTTLGSCSVTMEHQGNLNKHVMDEMADRQIKAFVEPEYWLSVKESYEEFKTRVQDRYDNHLIGDAAILTYNMYCDALANNNTEFGVSKK